MRSIGEKFGHFSHFQFQQAKEEKGGSNLSQKVRMWKTTCFWNAKWRDCWWSSWAVVAPSWVWEESLASSSSLLSLWRNRFMIHKSPTASKAITATTPKPNPRRIKPRTEPIWFETRERELKSRKSTLVNSDGGERESKNGANTEWRID